MEVHFTPEQEAQLAQIATNAGTDAEQLVKDVVLRLLQEDTGFPAALSGSVVAEMRALPTRVKNLTPKAGQRAITSTTVAGKCLG